MFDVAMAQPQDDLIQDIMTNSSLESISTDQLWEL
jgi:DNA-binding protein H-NS